MAMARSNYNSIWLNIECCVLLCNRRKYVTVVKECECNILDSYDLSNERVCRGASLLHRSQLLLLFLPIFRFFGVFASNFVVFFRNMLFGCSSLIKLLQIILYIESATLFTRQCFGVCTDTSKHTWIAFTQYTIFYKRCRFNFVHIVRSLSSLFIIYFFLFRTFRLFLQPLPLLRSRYLCVCVFFLFIYILFSSFFSLPLFLFFCSLPTKLYAYIYTARTNTHTHTRRDTLAKALAACALHTYCVDGKKQSRR